MYLRFDGLCLRHSLRFIWLVKIQKQSIYIFILRYTSIFYNKKFGKYFFR